MLAIIPVFYFVVIIAIAVGWIENIIKLVHMDVFSGLMILRVVGIFIAPLGAVLGYSL